MTGPLAPFCQGKTDSVRRSIAINLVPAAPFLELLMFFFSWRKWLSNLFRTARTRKTPHRRNPAAGLRARPRLELLEDRLAPTVTVMNVDSLVNDLTATASPIRATASITPPC